ncbi:MAG TPA: S8 family serine peptidase [Phycisphaerae bacterium]|nr:S8 family serine peptidase [Phycisphaerae bacterium]
MHRPAILAILMVLTAAAAVPAAPLVPNDPFYSYEWYGSALNLPTAWGLSVGSADVVVAVLDTGVMDFTPDLAGRVLGALSATGSAPLDGTANHHGTWVASVVGMGVNNGLGGAGVGNFRILPITVTDVGGLNKSEDIALGIRMAAEAGAKVINVSHGTLKYGPLDAAAAYARSLGALTFVAAGNRNTYNPMTGYDNLIFVSGTDPDDERWDDGSVGSSWGPYVDLSAPAVDILIADPDNPSLPSGYGIHYGTSYAAPLAAGAAAMAWSICPDLTADQVLEILEGTAIDLGAPGWDEVFGHGRVDIGAVASAAYALTPEPATLALVVLGLAGVLARRGLSG